LTQRWKIPVALRYALFQIPGVILLGLGLAASVRWWGLSIPHAWLIVGLWVAKDIVMFPFIKTAYESSSDSSSVDRLGGAIGVARQALNPSGYVSVGAELWNAELAPESAPVAVGSAVRVLEVRGLTLLVEPMPPEQSS
jgi:membrane protein implicated in regulation of membrane protease activity